MESICAGGLAYQYEGQSVIVFGSGSLHSFGWNAFGQLGTGEIDENGKSIPQRNTWLRHSKVKDDTLTKAVYAECQPYK